MFDHHWQCVTSYNHIAKEETGHFTARQFEIEREETRAETF